MTQRKIDVEIEVPGTPEQVWDAIATGPGISSWFMPVAVDERAGGEIVHDPGAEFSSTGTVTAWEPPHRFVYEEDGLPRGQLGTTLATEWLVEARGGGTCIVRVVMSGFGPGDEFDKPIESFTTGWQTALNDLRLYLTHFPGQSAASVTVVGTTGGRSKDDVWAQLTGALGAPADAASGERVAMSAGGSATMAGVVATSEPGILTLLLDEPAPGLGFVGAGGPGDEVYTFVRAHLFGDDAPAIAARDEPAWQAWMGEQFRS